MFQLSKAERDEVVTNCDHLKQLKYSTVMPRAFTEHGVLMLGSLLNSDTAIQTSLLVVRAFVKLRALLSSHTELAAKLTELEQRTTNNDQAITELVDAVRRFIQAPASNTRPIGFTALIKPCLYSRVNYLRKRLV